MAELRHWEALLAVSKLGSISAAADVLSVSQPALSKRVGELEHELGFRLFDRNARGVTPTPPARHLLPFASRVVSSFATVMHEAQDLKGLRTGRITIGSSTTIANYLLPAGLSLFAQRYPGIRVSMRVGNTEDIARLLLGEECEMGLVEGEIDHPELEVRTWFEDELIVVAPPGHPLTTLPRVRLIDVLAFGFVMRESGSGTRSVFESALEGTGLKVKELASLGSTEAMKAAVRLGFGIAAISRLTVAEDIAAGRLAEIKIEKFRIERRLNRLIHRGRPPTQSLRALFATLDGALGQDPRVAPFGEPGPVEISWDPVI